MIKCSSGKKQKGGFIFSLAALITAVTAAATSTAGTALISGAATALGSAAVNAVVGSGAPKLKKADLKPFHAPLEAVRKKINAAGGITASTAKTLASITKKAITRKHGQAGSGLIGDFVGKFAKVIQKTF